MEILLSAEIWISLLTLTALESVLGVDNLVFLRHSVFGLRRVAESRDVEAKGETQWQLKLTAA